MNAWAWLGGCGCVAAALVVVGLAFLARAVGRMAQAEDEALAAIYGDYTPPPAPRDDRTDSGGDPPLAAVLTDPDGGVERDHDSPSQLAGAATARGEGQSPPPSGQPAGAS